MESATPPEESIGPTTPSRWWRCVSSLPAALSASLCVVSATCYLARPDLAAALTVFPVWTWAVPGLLLMVPGLWRRARRVNLLLAAAWLFYLVILMEEPWSLLRSLSLPLLAPIKAGPGDQALRVISLNCAIGSRQAAEEVIPYRPDIVLLQESPNRGEVEALARRLFGSTDGVVYGVDASMIVNGRAVAAEMEPSLRGSCVQARVRLASGREIEVISTRLIPAVFRVDLWSPDCWAEQAENRRKRREQLRRIARRVSASPVPVVLGGDFNAPQGDAIFRLLRPRLRDAFADAGRGWGNTITNDFAMLRIDQIWISEEFRSSDLLARKTRHSDHRMVVCDLILRAEASRR